MHNLFKKRRSIRKFTPKEVDESQIRDILSAAMVAPSANNLHPLDFIIVKDRKTLKKLSVCGPSQEFVKDAPMAIVVVADPVKSKRFWLIDATLAAAHIYLEVANQGLAACWANIYQGTLKDGRDRESYVREVLNIPINKNPVCILPIGYPAISVSEHNEDEYEEDRIHSENW